MEYCHWWLILSKALQRKAFFKESLKVLHSRNKVLHSRNKLLISNTQLHICKALSARYSIDANQIFRKQDQVPLQSTGRCLQKQSSGGVLQKRCYFSKNTSGGCFSVVLNSWVCWLRVDAIPFDISGEVVWNKV